MHDPAPYQEPRGVDRWILLGAFLVALGFFVGIVLEDYQPTKLVPIFVLLAWFPLIAIHEAGHALVAKLFGWHVDEIVVGFGRPVVHRRVFGIPFTLKLYPLGGFVRPAPPHLRRVRMASALVYLAGPVSELVVLVAIILVFGDSLFAIGSDLPRLAAQGVAIAIGLGAISNLVPRVVQTERGPGITDGLGALTALMRPERHFVEQVLLTHAKRIADAGDAAGAVRACEALLSALPGEPDALELAADALRELSRERSERDAIRAAVRASHLPVSLVERFGQDRSGA